MHYGNFTTESGLRIDYFDTQSGADVLVYHHGTPAAGPIDADLVEAAKQNELRVVELVRPGYGKSARWPDRTVANIAPIATELARHLGFEKYVTLGWSGGGPHALANLALESDVCVAGLSLASVAPYNQPDLDFLAGMGQDNIEEFGAALNGEVALRPMLEELGIGMRDVSGGEIVEMLASILPEVDQSVLTGEFGDEMAQIFRWAVSEGIDGWLDDDFAFTKPWGFELSEIANPLAIWQGSEDLMVPYSHGEWLASKLPDAHVKLLQGEGHLSIGKLAFAEGIPWLKSQI